MYAQEETISRAPGREAGAQGSQASSPTNSLCGHEQFVLSSHICNMSRFEGHLRSFLALKLRCFPVHWAMVSHCGFLEPFLWPGSFPHFTFLFLALLCSLPFSSFPFSLCFPDPSSTLSPHYKLGIGKFPLGSV